MLDALHDAERTLPELLRNPDLWKSVFVDYHPPFVERLWCEWGGNRLYLHRIHPCAEHEALFHPHPWPSAMRILSGTYEMAVGYGIGEELPPVAAKIIFGVGSEYEMTDPNGWHYVRPLGEPTMSLMITGKPWERWAPKSERSLSPLASDKEAEILEFFRTTYR